MKTTLLLPIAALTATLACGCSGAEVPTPAAGPVVERGEAPHRAGARHPENPRPDWWHSTVRIKNASSWSIHKLNLTRFDATDWGPDQLGERTLTSGGALELHDIDCDTYDLRVVDQDGDICIVQDIDLCLQDATWTLTNRELTGCEADTESDGHAAVKPSL